MSDIQWNKDKDPWDEFIREGVTSPWAEQPNSGTTEKTGGSNPIEDLLLLRTKLVDFDTGPKPPVYYLPLSAYEEHVYRQDGGHG